MKNLNTISQELFSKIRSRFTKVTIGDKDGNVVTEPNDARFFEFEFSKHNPAKITITLSEEDGIVIMHGTDVLENALSSRKQDWFNFLKELRTFSKKRMLNFNIRDISKDNLTKRDYKYLAQKNKDETMTNESKLYGTSKTSYQNVGEARVAIKHREPIDQTNSANRARRIESIYIESNNGERFKYPIKHLNGARAMARHVSEGGNPYDSFGKYIVSLSEELGKLRKFKTYMGRSAIMAEGLKSYIPVIQDRLTQVKKETLKLQNESYYTQVKDSYKESVIENVPDEVAENWIDQLTIRQFNEDLKDVFPYIYRLVSENTKAKEIDLENFNIESEDEKSQESTTIQMKPDAPEETERTSLGEFILSHYDRETGNFPKGETAVLTMIEKDYGEQFINPEKDFIERIKTTYDSYQIKENPQSLNCIRMKELAGVK